MLDWDNLRVILAVAREGTIMGAARELDVNMSTVSRQISRAEDVLQAKLFDRRHKGLSPTLDGRLAIKAAEAMEEQVIGLLREVQGSNELEAGLIRLSLPLNIMQYGFDASIRRFQQEHPDITFQINATDETVDFSDLKADVALRVEENPPSSLWGFKIATIDPSFYVSKQFMEEWGAKIKNEPKTAPIPYITLSLANPKADREEFLNRFPKAKNVASCNGMDSVAPLVRSGVGAGRMMRYMANSYPDLIKLFECDNAWRRTVWIMTHRDFRNTRRIRLFMEYRRDELNSKLNSF